MYVNLTIKFKNNGFVNLRFFIDLQSFRRGIRRITINYSICLKIPSYVQDIIMQVESKH